MSPESPGTEDRRSDSAAQSAPATGARPPRQGPLLPVVRVLWLATVCIVPLAAIFPISYGIIRMFLVAGTSV